ncbi:MAG: GatB/YqeY domain-containing protein [Pseudomonadota bacterium]
MKRFCVSSITTRLEAALVAAGETDDDVRACTLRLMLAAVRDREAQASSDEGVVALEGAALRDLLSSMVRQRERSIREYEEQGHADMAERERDEIAVIKSFLPKPMTRDETDAAVAKAIEATAARSIRDMGRVMGHLRENYPGRIDFCEAGARVKAALG